MSNASISLKVRSNTSAGLQLNLKFNNSLVKSFMLTDKVQEFCYEFDNSPSNHVMEFEIANKLPSFTKLNECDQIVEDIVAEIFDIKLSDIKVDDEFYQHCVYFHDYNGTTKPTIDHFYRFAGCNGTIKFEFYTPVYLWLYDNI
jgi:hypothetical protein